MAMNPYLRQQKIFGQFDNIDPNDYGMGQVPIFTGMESNTPPYAPPGPVMDPRPPSMATSQSVQGPPAPTMDPGLKSIIDQMNAGYTPDYTSRDRLNRLLDAPPERNKPSWARKLVAGGLSLKSEDPIATAEKAMYAPYLRDQAEWTGKTAPFAQAAQLENTANIQERTLVGNAATAHAAQVRADTQQRIADAKNETAQKRAENDNIRARAYAAKNNGYTIHKAGDRYIGINPQGQRIDVGPSGGLDRETELDIMGEWGVKRAEAQGAAAVDTARAGAQATGRDLIVVNGVTHRYNPDTMEYEPVRGLPQGTPTRPGTPPRGGNEPLDVLRERNNKFLSIADQYPQIAEKWFTPPASPGDNWRLKPPPEPSFWSDKKDEIAEYAKVRQLLGIDPTPTEQVAPPQQGGSIPAPPGTNSGLGPQNVPVPKPAPVGGTNPRDPNYGKNVPATAAPPVNRNTNPRSIASTPPPKEALEPGHIMAQDTRTGNYQQITLENWKKLEQMNPNEYRAWKRVY